MPDSPAPAPSAAAPAPAAPPPTPSKDPSPPSQATPPPARKPPARESAWDEIERMSKEETPKAPAPKKEGKESPPPKPPSKAADRTASTQSREGTDGTGTTKETPDVALADSESPESASDSGHPQSPSAEAKPVKAAELRAAYENLKREHAKLKEEASKAKPAEDPDKPKLVAELEQTRKRAAELEAEIRYTNYERSQEYQEKYEKPFVESYQNGRRKAMALKVTTPEGTTRDGASADFDAIMAVADDSKAGQLASEMFGSLAPLILYHREKVIEANRSRQNAIEEFRKTGSEREKQRAADLTALRTKQQQAQQKLNEEFARLNEESKTKFPEFFQAEEGDDKGKELLEKGFDRSKRAFSGDRTIPPEELVALHSAIHNKAAAFDYLVHKNRAFKAKIASLEKELSEFKNSEPGADGGKGPKPKKGLSAFEEIDALARENS